MGRLLPVKNYRYVVPHVCIFCRHMTQVVEGSEGIARETSAFVCARPDGPVIDGADHDGLFAMTCDGWTPQPRESE